MKIPLKLREKVSRRGLISFLLVALGTVLISAGTALFILPFELVTGGISGLSIVISRIYPFSEIPIALIASGITWACFFIGWGVMGRSFAAKTLLSSLLYPPLLSLFISLFSADSLGGYFHLPSSAYGADAVIICALFGGATIGIGCGIAFKGGGSTGGTDVFALIAADKSKRLSASAAVFLTDGAIILLGAVSTGDFAKTLMGILTAVLTAFFIQKTLEYTS